MDGPFVADSIHLIKAAVTTGDHSDILALPREKMQCVADVTHEVGYQHLLRLDLNRSFML